MDVDEFDPIEKELRTNTRWLSALSMRVRIIIVLFLALVVAALFAWMQRESIARNIVGNILDEQGIAATYEFESIKLDQQIVRNLVIGAPDNPDMTIDRLILDIRPDLSGPKVEKVRVEKLRVFGQYRDGKLSFGALDKFLFTESDTAPELPDLILNLVDARGLVETDYGNVGFAVDGSGHLRDGFAAKIAAFSNGVDLGGCKIARGSVFGVLAIVQLEPKFSGPSRFNEIRCPDQNAVLATAETQIDFTISRTFKEVAGNLASDFRDIVLADAKIDRIKGETAFGFEGEAIEGSFDWTAQSSAMQGFNAGTLQFVGDYVLPVDLAAPNLTGQLTGRQLNYAGTDWQSLKRQIASLDETPVGPIAKQIVYVLEKRSKNASFDAGITFSKRADDYFIQLADVRLRGGDGAPILLAPQLAINRQTARNRTQVSGSVNLGGQGLPDWLADIIPLDNGGYRIALSASEYRAGNARLGLQRVSALVSPSGQINFDGQATISGPLPGGRVNGLVLPLRGSWNSASGLALYNRCENFRFASLQVSGLSSRNQTFRLCPPQGSAILVDSGQGYRFAATTPSLNFKGQLGESPLSVRGEKIAFAMPGEARFANVKVQIGPDDAATRLTAASLTANFGEQITGRFDDMQATIVNVPLILARGRGEWQFKDSVLSLDAEEWFLRDSNVPARFMPLVTNNAQLTLSEGRIRARGDLAEPQTARNIVGVEIVHNLSTVSGQAVLNVAAVKFDERLQPDMLTPLALGVVANVQGTMAGNGLIRWGENGVTSSGRFNTNNMDLAAAFGPVKGLSGEIVFTDLLNMITAPDQIVRVAQINPGVAVDDGVIRYRLANDFRMHIESGVWLFAGGQLIMQPTTLALATDDPKSLNFKIESLDAAKFLQRLEFENLSATGIFDGSLPMVFDQNGGRILEGYLRSREGGGSLAYVGELTYEDMGAMANFAFNALRDIKYRTLAIDMNGAIDGELITNVRFSGLQQGERASRNFITKQLDHLPIQFNVTITAPFMQLMTTTRSLYDSSYIRDPVAAGAIDKLRADQFRKATTGTKRK